MLRLSSIQKPATTGRDTLPAISEGESQPQRQPNARTSRGSASAVRASVSPASPGLCRQHETPLRGGELTQVFFAPIIEQGGFTSANPECGRFRSYLLGGMKHFLANEGHRAQRRSAEARCSSSGGTCSIRRHGTASWVPGSGFIPSLSVEGVRMSLSMVLFPNTDSTDRLITMFIVVANVCGCMRRC